MEQMEQTSARKPLQESLVKRVFYGAWDGTKKIIESQSPEAWGNRIIRVIDTKILPKLSPEQQQWAQKHQEFIRDAAMYAGVGITTAEIVGAVALGAKAIEPAKRQLELVRARRLVQYVSSGPDVIIHPYTSFPFIEEKIKMPNMPVTVATEKTYALKPETRQKLYQYYFEEGRETGQMLKLVRKKWKDIKPTFGENHWVREQLNGTLATLFDMTEDETFRQLVDHALEQSKDGVMSPEFRSLFQKAHRVANERFRWHAKIDDSGRMWKFWNSWFGQEGVDMLRVRAKRFVRPIIGLPDPAIYGMIKHIEYTPTVYSGFIPSDFEVWRDMATQARITTGTVFEQMRANSILEKFAEKSKPFRAVYESDEQILHRLSGPIEQAVRNKAGARERGKRVLKDAIRLMPEVTWNNPAIAAKIQRAAQLLTGEHAPDIEAVAQLVDRAWEIRNQPEIRKLAIDMRAANTAHRAAEARTYATQILDRVVRSNKQFAQRFAIQGTYYQVHDRLRDLASVWVDRLHAVGTTDLMDAPQTITRSARVMRIITNIAQRLQILPLLRR